ncbi:MAG: ribonuclease P protein component [Candidatus Sungiibacteriota bacterium]
MTLPRIHRLGRREMGSLFKRNSVASNEAAILRFAARPNQPFSRFAVVISRQVARKSTDRNRLRRRASGWLEEHLSGIQAGFDVALILREKASGLPRRDFYSALGGLFKKTPLL